MRPHRTIIKLRNVIEISLNYSIGVIDSVGKKLESRG